MKPKDYYKKVGAKIRELRIKKGMTQVQLAHDCDMEKQAMQRIEKQGTNLTLATLLKISNSLGVELCELVK